MEAVPVSVKGHYHPVCDHMEYDGLISFKKGEMPEVIEIDGTYYQKVHRPAGYVNPEMHQVRETR